MQIGSRTRDVDAENIVGDVEDRRLREESRSCQQFSVDSNLKGRDTKYSMTQWKLSTKQSWTGKLMIFSTIWNGQQKWIWFLVSFWKIKKMECSDTLTHTKTIPCWIDPNLCAPMTTWQSWKIFSTKLTSKSLVAENEWTQSGGSTNYQTWPYLQLFSKKFLWVARTQSYPNFYLKITQSVVSRMQKISGNRLTITSASSVRLLSFCMALNELKKKIQNCSIYPSIIWMDWAQSHPGSPHERHFYCWRPANSQNPAVCYRYFGWEHCRRTCMTKCAEIRKYCETAKIQQPHILRERQ